MYLETSHPVLRSASRFVPPNYKSIDGYTLIAKVAGCIQENIAASQNQSSTTVTTALQFSVPSSKIQSEVEEGEITFEEQEEELRQRERRELEGWKEKKRKEREEKAKEWKMDGAKVKMAKKKERWAMGLKDAQRDRVDATEQYDRTVGNFQAPGVWYPRPAIHSKKGNYKNRVGDFKHSNFDRTGKVSDYHECKHITADHERAHVWGPQQHSRAFHRGLASPVGTPEKMFPMKPKSCGSRASHQLMFKNVHGLERLEDVPAHHLSDLPAEKQQVNRPVENSLTLISESFNDRDDVGEWRIEIHDI